MSDLFSLPKRAHANAVAQHLLTSVFGHTALRPEQKTAVASVLARQNTLVLMPTGGGKSLCYQLPALAFRRMGEGPTLVISPLIALMNDQVTQLTRRGVRAVALHSQQTEAQAEQAWQALRKNDCDVVFMAPERAVLPGTRRLLLALRPSLLAIDEAHCVSLWGHDFRPEYRALGALNKQLQLPVVALTATATPEVLTDIARSLQLASPTIVTGSFRRPNLGLHVHALKGSKPREARLLALLQAAHLTPTTWTQGAGRAIIYAATRRRVEAVTDILTAEKIRCVSYHGGQTAKVRAAQQERFEQGLAPVMVATQAFGMGIDYGDVRLVVHVQAPGSLSAYYQEVGRAGRDGAPAACHLFYGAQDWAIARQLQRHAPKAHALALAAMQSYCGSSLCRQAALSVYFRGAGVTAQDRIACGACDICLGLTAVAAGTVKVESPLPPGHPDRALLFAAVDALVRPVGASVVVAAVRGSRAKTVLRRGLGTLPQYGQLGGYSVATLMATVAAMLEAQELVQKGRKYPTVWVPHKAVRTQPKKAPAGRSKKPVSKLLRALTLFCRRTARAHGYKKPYMVMTRQLMADVVMKRPQTHDELAALKGIGAAKMALFGDALLTLVHGHNDTINENS